MNPTRRALCAATSLAPFAAPLRAQEWPAKPIRIVVPYPAGGNADSAARVLAEAVAPALKQPLLVDNRPGASTILGTDMVARAAPDGHTIGLVTDSHAINQALAKTSKGAELLGAKPPYDAIRDFAPICGVALVPLVLVVNPKVPARTVKELVAFAQSRRDQGANFGTMGTGSPWFVHMHPLRKLFGAELVDVPYKGLAPAATDLVGGHRAPVARVRHRAQDAAGEGEVQPHRRPVSRRCGGVGRADPPRRRGVRRRDRRDREVTPGDRR